MPNFRLPDFRWLHFFRDRQQRTTDNSGFPQYPGPGPIPEQWRQSQNHSGQYPLYLNPSGHPHPGPWPGYAVHPSQANPRNYASQLPSQYQQHHQHHHARDAPNLQTHPQFQSRPQPHTAPPYVHPSQNPYRHRSGPRPSQDGPRNNHNLGVPGGNTPFNRSRLSLPAQSGQSSAHLASRAPSSNVSRVPSHHGNQNSHLAPSLNQQQRRSRSQGSTTRPRSASAASGASSRRSTSNAPQIKSRMLKISLDQPLVCGLRHSLIPDQIPETEVGKPEKSTWDNRQFSLPPGIQVPMMIDAVQVCSLNIEWDITLPPAFAEETGRDGQIFTPPRHLHLPLINAKFNSDVCIKTRQDNPLTKCFLRWGCIVVESRDPTGITPTMKQFLYDIWDYFQTPLTEEECSMFSTEDMDKLREIAASRIENYTKEGEQPNFNRGRGPTRRDVLWGYTRFAGLEVCPRFRDTGDLFLYLEPL